MAVFVDEGVGSIVKTLSIQNVQYLVDLSNQLHLFRLIIQQTFLRLERHDLSQI